MKSKINNIEIQYLQLQQMLSGSNTSLATSSILAVFLAYIQRNVIDPAVDVAWLSIVLILTISRTARVGHYQRSIKEGSSASHNLIAKYRIGVIASGVLWGSAGILLFPANDQPHQLFLIFMLAGLTAGGIVSYSADMVCAIGFSVAALLPLIIRLNVAGDSLSVSMSLAIILYLGFMIMSGRKSNQQIHDNIVLRLEATSREKTIRESEDHYRLLLMHSPVGLFHYDANLVITYCNDHFAEILKSSIDRIVGLDMKTLKDQSVLPSLIKALEGELALYEGHYLATLSDANGWIAMTCAPARDIKEKIVGGIAIVQDITERKKINDALKESELRLRTIINTEPECVKVVDSKGRLLEMNAAGLAMLEAASLDEAQQSSLLDYVVPEDRATFRTLHKKVMDGGNGKAEFKIKGLKGTTRYLETHATPLRDINGDITALLGITRDITERKRNEDKIIENEQRLLEILELSPIAVQIATRHGRKVVFHNQRYDDLIKSPNAIGDDPKNYYSRTEDYEKILVELAQRRSVINRQVELTIPNSSTVWVLASYMPMQYQGEEAVLGWFYDISERIKTEMDNKIAATAFESQEGMFITDADNNILRVNHAFTDITGYAADEVLGKNPRIFGSGRQDKSFYANMWKSINNNGAWEGEIWNRRKNSDIYPQRLSVTAVKDSNGKISNYVASLIDITQRKKSEEEIQHLAFYDHLTDLPNRRLLVDRLKQAIAASSRSLRKGALLFIDLDNFKDLNDTLGHDMGDMLLLQVANRLTACVREGDTVARLGGDEFVVVLEDLSEQAVEAAEQAELVGEKILANLRQPYQLAATEYNCTSTIGLTLFDSHGNDMDELLKQADIAMYQAKKEGRNTMRFFDPLMHDAIKERAALEGELRNALDRHQFQIHYQIQMTSQHKPFGAEALIRWIHPERGIVSPAEFIPLAEETGLILSIGKWVLETACAQLKLWAHDAHARNLQLAVNVSAKQFRQGNFATQVREIILDHGINPGLLKLELTESLLVENVEETIAIMNELNELGVQLSLDDFGTGYSSLQYLKRLPLDQLKIDQTFVRDLAVDNNDKAIVRTIIAMADSMFLDVIAEGVETEEQRLFLMDSGCTHYQGYLFGKPVPIEQFEALLKGS